jgi:hypothetical protein
MERFSDHAFRWYHDGTCGSIGTITANQSELVEINQQSTAINRKKQHTAIAIKTMMANTIVTTMLHCKGRTTTITLSTKVRLLLAVKRATAITATYD